MPKVSKSFPADSRARARAGIREHGFKTLAAEKRIQQAALPRIVIHNQNAGRLRRRFGCFGWHSPRLDKSAGRQKKFSKAGFNAKHKAVKRRRKLARHEVSGFDAQLDSS